MSKPRVSTHQLKHLLENFPIATSESPLIAMYRSMIEDALLDLTDAIGEQARLSWYVKRMDAGIEKLKNDVLDLHAKQRISSDDCRQLCHTLDWADGHPPADLVKEALAPLTEKTRGTR